MPFWRNLVSLFTSRSSNNNTTTTPEEESPIETNTTAIDDEEEEEDEEHQSERIFNNFSDDDDDDDDDGSNDEDDDKEEEETMMENNVDLDHQGEMVLKSETTVNETKEKYENENENNTIGIIKKEKSSSSSSSADYENMNDFDDDDDGDDGIFGDAVDEEEDPPKMMKNKKRKMRNIDSSDDNEEEEEEDYNAHEMTPITTTTTTTTISYTKRGRRICPTNFFQPQNFHISNNKRKKTTMTTMTPTTTSQSSSSCRRRSNVGETIQQYQYSSNGYANVHGTNEVMVGQAMDLGVPTTVTRSTRSNVGETIQQQYSSNGYVNVHGTATTAATPTTMPTSAKAYNRRICNPYPYPGTMQQQQQPQQQQQNYIPTVQNTAVPRGVHVPLPTSKATNEFIASVDLQRDVVYDKNRQLSMRLISIKGIRISLGFWDKALLRKLCAQNGIPLLYKNMNKEEICQSIVAWVMALGVPSIDGTTTNTTSKAAAATTRTDKAYNRTSCNPHPYPGTIQQQQNSTPIVQNVVIPRGVYVRPPTSKATNEFIASVDLQRDVVYDKNSQLSMRLISIKGIHMSLGFWGREQLRKLCTRNGIPLIPSTIGKEEMCHSIVKWVIALGVPSRDWNVDNIRNRQIHTASVSAETPTMMMLNDLDRKEEEEQQQQQATIDDDDQFQDSEEKEKKEYSDGDDGIYLDSDSEQKRKPMHDSEGTNSRSNSLHGVYPMTLVQPEESYNSIRRDPCSRKRHVTTRTTSPSTEKNKSNSNTIPMDTNTGTAIGTTASPPLDESSIPAMPTVELIARVDIRRDVVYAKNRRFPLNSGSGTTRLVSIIGIRTRHWTKANLLSLCRLNSIPGVGAQNNYLGDLNKWQICEMIVERAIAWGALPLVYASDGSALALTNEVVPFNLKPVPGAFTAPVFPTTHRGIPFPSAPALESSKMTATGVVIEEIIAKSNLRQDVMFDQNVRQSVGGSTQNSLQHYKDGKTRLLYIRGISPLDWSINQLKRFCVRNYIFGSEAYDKAGICELIVERAIYLDVPSTNTRSTTQQRYPNRVKIAGNSMAAPRLSDAIAKINAGVARVETSAPQPLGVPIASVPEPKLPVTVGSDEFIATSDIRRDVVYDSNVWRTAAACSGHNLEKYTDGKTRLVSIRGVPTIHWDIHELKRFCIRHSITAGYTLSFDTAGICELIVERAIYMGVPSTNTSGTSDATNSSVTTAATAMATEAPAMMNPQIPIPLNDVSAEATSLETTTTSIERLPGCTVTVQSTTASTPVGEGVATLQCPGATNEESLPLAANFAQMMDGTSPVPSVTTTTTATTSPAMKMDKTMAKNSTMPVPDMKLSFQKVTDEIIASVDLIQDILYDQTAPKCLGTRLVAIKNISIHVWTVDQLKKLCAYGSAFSPFGRYSEKVAICEFLVEQSIALSGGSSKMDTTRNSTDKTRETTKINNNHRALKVANAPTPPPPPTNTASDDHNDSVQGTLAPPIPSTTAVGTTGSTTCLSDYDSTSTEDDYEDEEDDDIDVTSSSSERMGVLV